MKKILKIILVTILLGVLIGCAKNVTKVSYSKFNEYFSNKKEYKVIDNTSNYDINIRKYIEAGEGNFQIFYIEYDSEKSADNYMDGLKDDKETKVTKYDKYTYAENTNGQYMVVYKIDETVVIGRSNDKKYRNQINSVLRDLGY